MAENNEEQYQSQLNPSEIGKLEYWENTYAMELTNFKDHGDVGKVWFGKNAATKIVSYISKELNLSKVNDEIIDLGCGNGMMLVDLAKEGFQRLMGVDYSRTALDLAQKVMDEHNVQNVELNFNNIYSELDDSMCNRFKVVHDKGTYDAIGLSEMAAWKQATYMNNVDRMMKKDGYFVITSCNYTKDELVQHFRPVFQLHWEIPNKTISFGGKSGSAITQLVFIKRED